jgi:hypothetical protein
MNPIHPKLLSGQQRRAEIAALLAKAILRQRARQAAQTKQEAALKELDCQGASRLHTVAADR